MVTLAIETTKLLLLSSLVVSMIAGITLLEILVIGFLLGFIHGLAQLLRSN